MKRQDYSFLGGQILNSFVVSFL
uniref:Uncharacterized protein n=1 Tax=Rhizophora mucronata TaxID=61149 RepID=A0A2P2KAB2_RHIMU